MSDIIFDKNVPIPPALTGPDNKYAPMEVGDSYFFPGLKNNQAAARFSSYRKRFGWKIATRSLTENGVQGIRVWRVK